MADNEISIKQVYINDSIKKIYISNKFFITLLVGLSVYAVFYLLAENHIDGSEWGWLSILPTVSVLCIAILSRRPFESMLAGVLAGLIMISPDNIIAPFTDSVSSVMGDETIVWIILVCGLMGGFIRILEISSCLDGFTEWLKTKITSRRQSTIATG